MINKLIRLMLSISSKGKDDIIHVEKHEYFVSIDEQT
jgi:hypothetical protein